MSDPIAVALITATQAVVVALIGVLFTRLGKVRRDAEETRNQIVNDHPAQPNFRDENDERHAETRSWWDEVRRDLGGIREELRGLRSTDRALERRVTQLENHERTTR